MILCVWFLVADPPNNIGSIGDVGMTVGSTHFDSGNIFRRMWNHCFFCVWNEFIVSNGNSSFHVLCGIWWSVCGVNCNFLGTPSNVQKKQNIVKHKIRNDKIEYSSTTYDWVESGAYLVIHVHVLPVPYWIVI